MKLVSKLLFVSCLFVCVSFTSCQTTKEDPSVNVLVITGGHEYEKEAFESLLSKLPATCDLVEHPAAYPLWKADQIAKYDVVVLYDMPSDIPEEARLDLVAMLEKGKGLVVLHHAFCSYEPWPEYTRIAGGRYHHYAWTKDGVEQTPSTYRHGVTFLVKVLDTVHPVTKGIADFQTTDETYYGTEILPEVHPLLGTGELSSAPLLAWTHTYGRSRVLTFTLGHDPVAWENPAFVKFLSQAVVWTAGTNKE
jgi:type 1 glutamine amidotransferase